MAAPKIAYVSDVGQSHLSLDMPRHPPRLSVALMWAKPGFYPTYQTDLEKDKSKNKVSLAAADFDADLPRLLKHILQRLQIGLYEAWWSKFGYDAPPMPNYDGLTDEEKGKKGKAWLEKLVVLNNFFQEPEEEWARCVTEAFTFAPYAGLGQMVFNNNQKDAKVYEKFPKVVATFVACQHLSTYAILMRGFDLASLSTKYTTGLTAGVCAGLPIYKKGSPAGWFGAPDAEPGHEGKSELDGYKNHDLHQGDYAGGQENKEQKGFAHIASVLRRWPLGTKAETDAQNQGAEPKLQMIDTGVVTGAGDGATQDHDWLDDGRISGAFSQAKFGGVGRLPPAPDLRSAVETARAARPLGFARLVIVDAGGRARYVSAMLPMWFGETPFPIPRLLWSLRDLPVGDGGQVAYWLIYAPRGEKLFGEMVDHPSTTAGTMMKAAGKWELRLTAVVTSEPRVVRTITKTDLSWAATAPDELGEAHAYEPGSDKDKEWQDKYDKADDKHKPSGAPLASGKIYDHAEEQKAADAKAEAEGNPKKPVAVMFYPTSAAAKLPLTLDDKVTGAAAWQALSAEKNLDNEMIRKDPSAATMDIRPMSQNTVDYFKGP